MKKHPDDVKFMQHALRVAARHLGAAGENPSVGCVLVKEGRVIGTGVTALGGRPHAETQALAAAGDQARGATAYVTLEPCAHHGKTPPCAEALIHAGITRVVVACTDSDARVRGKGIALLEAAGIDVVLGVCEDEARLQHQGFFRRLHAGLPRVTMKLARSADGFMGYVDPARKDITGKLARSHGQALRSRVGAVIAGIGTVLTDDPKLNVRIDGLENRQPQRIILDRQLRTPLSAYVVRTANKQPTTIITTADAVEHAGSHGVELRELGVNIIAHAGDFSVKEALHYVASLGVNHAMIEAGPVLSAAALASGCIDMVYDYRSPYALAEAGSHPFRQDFSEKAHLITRLPLAQDTLSVYAFA